AIDMGYLNRVTKRLASLRLVATGKDREDGRILVLELTRAGRKALEEINEASDARTVELFSALSDDEVRSLVKHLNAAETILERRSANPPRIEAAVSSFDVATARVLMREYAAFLGEDLSFQGFEKELANLPGRYAPPSGALLVARVPTGTGGTEPAGCVALRKLSPGICEMKRMFVRPEYRGLGIGRLLAEHVIGEARSLGYRTMRLDTLERLQSAVSLYREMGFVPIPPYCPNPLPGVMFWEKDLRVPARSFRRRLAP
ncbi:MAG TPA: bifunctional helix-turn-helix transcriptional regulator/GNAT family N-acetyltransferase, partial [Spirochaetia bacterium]|nr:bifunctional helix-turn-helix transcriptional regulator/GNAT family N-acetyltransferase [Spirochaetia bacterium]